MSGDNFVTLAVLAKEMGLKRDSIYSYARKHSIPMLAIPWHGSPTRNTMVLRPEDAAWLKREHAARENPKHAAHKNPMSGRTVPGRRYINMVGQKLYRLTFLEYRGVDNQGSGLWLCRCDCGVEKVLQASVIRYGSIKSCGCLRRGNFLTSTKTEAHRQRVRQIGLRNKGRRNFSQARKDWKCRTCGADFGMALAKDKKFRIASRFCSSECWYEYIRIYPDQHPSWRGGHQPYYGPIWDRQSSTARARDNSTCQHCGKYQVKPRLQVHHLNPLRNFTSWEDANQLSNLITLCKRCHKAAECKLDRERVAQRQTGSARCTVA